MRAPFSMDGGQFEHGEEVYGMFFVARGDPPEMLEASPRPHVQ
jgi:hypothetical protein